MLQGPAGKFYEAAAAIIAFFKSMDMSFQERSDDESFQARNDILSSQLKNAIKQKTECSTRREAGVLHSVWLLAKFISLKSCAWSQ